MARKNTGEIYVAKETFTTEIDGAHLTVIAGQTRVREGHPLLRGREQFFTPLDVQYDVETATAEPGEKRGAVPTAPPLNKKK